MKCYFCAQELKLVSDKAGQGLFNCSNHPVSFFVIAQFIESALIYSANHMVHYRNSDLAQTFNGSTSLDIFQKNGSKYECILRISDPPEDVTPENVEYYINKFLNLKAFL
jgi:hypothetical protein